MLKITPKVVVSNLYALEIMCTFPFVSRDHKAQHKLQSCNYFVMILLTDGLTKSAVKLKTNGTNENAWISNWYKCWWSVINYSTSPTHWTLKLTKQILITLIWKVEQAFRRYILHLWGWGEAGKSIFLKQRGPTCR